MQTNRSYCTDTRMFGVFLRHWAGQPCEKLQMKRRAVHSTLRLRTVTRSFLGFDRRSWMFPEETRCQQPSRGYIGRGVRLQRWIGQQGQISGQPPESLPTTSSTRFVPLPSLMYAPNGMLYVFSITSLDTREQLTVRGVSIGRRTSMRYRP